MSVEVYAATFKLTEAIARHARDCVKVALRAAGDRVESAIVRLADIHADRGGVDKLCRIVVRLDGAGTVVAKSVDRDLYAAIDRASARLRKIVMRQISRRRTLRRESAQRLPAPTRWGRLARGAT